MMVAIAKLSSNRLAKSSRHLVRIGFLNDVDEGIFYYESKAATKLPHQVDVTNDVSKGNPTPLQVAYDVSMSSDEKPTPDFCPTQNPYLHIKGVSDEGNRRPFHAQLSKSLTKTRRGFRNSTRI